MVVTSCAELRRLVIGDVTEVTDIIRSSDRRSGRLTLRVLGEARAAAGATNGYERVAVDSGLSPSRPIQSARTQLPLRDPGTLRRQSGAGEGEQVGGGEGVDAPSE